MPDTALAPPTSPERPLRQALAECRRLLSAHGEANGPAIATDILKTIDGWIGPGRQPQLDRFFDHLARDFSPDPQKVLAAAQAYAQAPHQVDHLIRLTQISEPPRQELFRRLNRAPGGTAALVRLRRALIERMARQPALAAVEADLLHLLSSWFNPGFLQLQRVDWNSPAQLLEQIIRHEAVHRIDGWDDLRRRLQPDRRCFAFFHPQLPGEPLIFVEVALLPEMPARIAPLIDKASPPLPAREFRVAAFYSISNCQPGLKGVSLGNFLIKRVAEELQRELPQLKTFCTLSPIPGFARWLRAGAPCAGLSRPRAERLAQAREALAAWPDAGAAPPALLLRLAAAYLAHATPAEGGDPVARFHLDNGARLERINAQADLSAKAGAQSLSLMVNYLYDLRRIEAHHEQFTQGHVACSRAVTALL